MRAFLDSLPEGAVFNHHDQVNGIEVFLAAKAAGQIGLGIHRRVEFATQGAEKPEISFRHFIRQAKHISESESTCGKSSRIKH